MGTAGVLEQFRVTKIRSRGAILVRHRECSSSFPALHHSPIPFVVFGMVRLLLEQKMEQMPYSSWLSTQKSPGEIPRLFFCMYQFSHLPVKQMDHRFYLYHPSENRHHHQN